MRLTLVLVILVFQCLARAEIQSSFRNLFYDRHVSLEDKLLGRNCYSLSASPLGLTCNPALMAGEQKNLLRLNAVSDQTLSDALKYRDHILDDDIAELVDDMHKDSGKPILSNFATSVWYQNDWWAISYTPLRAGLASYVRNPTLSEITAHVDVESELKLQGGLYAFADNNLTVGASLRFVRTQFVRDQFLLIDALADPDLIQVQEHRAIYLDPAFAYSWDSAWEPTVSLMVTDVSIYKKGDDKEVQSSIEAGYSTTPDFLEGKLRTSLHLTSRPDVDDFEDRLRWGGLYDAFTFAALSFSISAHDHAIGFIGRLDSLTYGVGYKSEVLTLNGESLDRVSQASFELGLSF